MSHDEQFQRIILSAFPIVLDECVKCGAVIRHDSLDYTSELRKKHLAWHEKIERPLASVQLQGSGGCGLCGATLQYGVAHTCTVIQHATPGYERCPNCSREHLKGDWHFCSNGLGTMQGASEGGGGS